MRVMRDTLCMLGIYFFRTPPPESAPTPPVQLTADQKVMLWGWGNYRPGGG